MNGLLHHRGPDQEGTHLEPGVALAHRRLSIIDLGSGRQPLYNEDESVVVVFNGEIYNFRSLVPELTVLGHRFRTLSDTEVIVHGWETWGAGCVERFRGMFAFALWDRMQETLFLARDRVGKKPLYYAETADGRFLFASELKSILACPTLVRAIDGSAVEDFLALGYIPDPKSIYRHVRKLEPGCTMTIRRGAGRVVPAIRQYWNLRFDARAQGSEQALCAELIERFAEAVRVRMVAEVPLGAFLSGGVDSSAVVAMMAREVKEPVTTCSIAFSDPRFDESGYAQAISARYGTRHHVESVDADDFALLDRLVGIYDEPFADSSSLPTYRVCESARRHVTVALSGDGGDEGFAGYRRYRWHLREERLRTLLPQALRGPLFGALGAIYPKWDWAPRALRAKSTLQAIARDSLDAYFQNFALLPDAPRLALFSTAFRRDLAGYTAREVFARHAKEAPTHPLSFVQYLDFKTYLPGDILVKVDRASMAHSLEVRVPLLDHHLLEWQATLAPSLKLCGGAGKYLFKRALEPYLPADILYRPKMGFAVPLARWFRGPLAARVRSAVLGEVLLDSGYFNAERLRALVDEHLGGSRDHSAALWSLLMFEGFLRGRTPSAPANAAAA
jgi:asparagine synthase (glutamine-hydrolysing)